MSDSVYLMRAGEFYKIGVSVNPKKRRKQMQTGCPRNIEIVYAFPDSDAYRLEGALHELYEDNRTSGEWFIGICEDEFTRAVEAYPCYLKQETSEPFKEYFNKYCSGAFSIYADVAEHGYVTEGSREYLSLPSAAFAINEGIKAYVQGLVGPLQ